MSELSPEEIPVGRTFWTWWFVVPLAVALLLGATAALANNRHIQRLAIPLAAGLGVWVAGSLASLLYSRRWLKITPTGFQIRSLLGACEYHDDDVRGLADERTVRFASGRPFGEFRVCTLRFASGSQPERLPLLRYLGIDELDPLDVLIERLKCRIFQSNRHSLEMHKPIGGTGWSWSGQVLNFEPGQRSVSAEIDSITHVDRLGHNLLVWVQGKELPIAVLPAGGDNCWLLEDLLRVRLTSNQPPEAGTLHATGTPLGRILAERKPGYMVAWSMFALGAFAAGVAIVCCIAAVLLQTWLPAILAISVGFPGLMVFTLGRRVSQAVFRIGEFGIEKRGIHGYQRLLLGQIGVMQFDARRQRSYGRFVGILYTLTFASLKDHTQGILHSETTPQEDPVLTELRNRVAREIVRSMAREYAAEGSVRWTPELMFSGEAVVFRPLNVFGWGRRPASILLEEVLDFEIDGEWFHLWSIADQRAVIKVRSSTPNFFPGLLLLEGLCAEREKKSKLRFTAHVNGTRPS